MVSSTESFTIHTITKRGRCLRIREMNHRDTFGIHACVLAPSFRMPYLTGTPDPIKKPVRPWIRSVDYMLKASISRRFGRMLFGARRHWIMIIEDVATRRFIGVTLLDAVVRFPLQPSARFNDFLIESHKRRAQRVGDAEWGFFLHPDFWGQGIALQAIYAQTKAL